MTTWDLTYEKYINYKLAYCGKNTISKYKSYLKRFINFCKDSEIDIHLISDSDVYEFMYLLRCTKTNRKKEYSERTLKLFAMIIRNYLSFLFEHGYIEKDISVNVPSKSCPDNIVIPLSQTECDKIFDCFDVTKEIHARYNLIFRLMLDQGLRVSECISMDMGDIDIANNCVVVRDSKYYKSRVVPLSARVAEAYKNYVSHIKRSAGAMFLSNCNKRISDTAIFCYLDKLRVALGIPRLHNHLFRHTFACSFVLLGGSIELLRRYLGHSSLTTTIIYLKNDMYYKSLDNIYRLDENFKLTI